MVTPEQVAAQIKQERQEHIDHQRRLFGLADCQCGEQATVYVFPGLGPDEGGYCEACWSAEWAGVLEDCK